MTTYPSTSAAPIYLAPVANKSFLISLHEQLNKMLWDSGVGILLLTYIGATWLMGSMLVHHLAVEPIPVGIEWWNLLPYLIVVYNICGNVMVWGAGAIRRLIRLRNPSLDYQTKMGWYKYEY